MNCDAILFDLDGVLVDSAECVEGHWRRWATSHNLDVGRILEVAHGRRTVETILQFAPQLDAEAEAAELTQAEETDTRGVNEVQGARDLLCSLPRDVWAIVTSGNAVTAVTRIDHTGLPRPGVLVTSDDVLEGKPHPEPYLRAASVLNVAPSDCVVVEDTPTGIESAHAAGMRAVAVASTHERGVLKDADMIVDRLRDLVVDVNSDEGNSRFTVCSRGKR